MHRNLHRVCKWMARFLSHGREGPSFDAQGNDPTVHSQIPEKTKTQSTDPVFIVSKKRRVNVCV